MSDLRRRDLTRSFTIFVYNLYASSMSTSGKRVHWGEPKMEPTTDTVAIVAFEIYFASATIS
jgi:hypothetical protein